MIVLVVCAHGTRSPQGQQTVASITAEVAARLPGVMVRDAYVDVQEPNLADLVDDIVSAGERVVVVPLLLSTGFHIETDVAGAVGRFPGRAISSGPLGPHPLLTRAAIRRLRDAGSGMGDAVVFAVAGSSRPEAAEMGRQAARMLAEAWDAPVYIGFAAAVQPDVATAVRRARAIGLRIVVASYLIGEGYFHDVLMDAGADLVTAPLGAAPELIDLVVERYRAALAELDAGRRG